MTATTATEFAAFFSPEQTWLEKAFLQIQKAVIAGKLAHGQLIVAPEGSGKSLFANSVAKSIICEKSRTQFNKACGQCKNCLLIESTTHPDLSILDCLVDNKGKQKKTIGIDQVRELTAKLLETPQFSGWRVAIIMSVEKLTRGAFNALLKTLEEPKENTLILMLASNLQQVPATVRSRCQQINFKLSNNVLVPWLIRQAECEKLVAEEALAECMNSPFNALQYIQQGLSERNRELMDDLDKVLQIILTPHQFIEKYAALDTELWVLLASYFQKVQLSVLESNQEQYNQVPIKLPSELYSQLLKYSRGQSGGSNLQYKLQLEAILTQWFEIGRKIVHYSNR